MFICETCTPSTIHWSTWTTGKKNAYWSLSKKTIGPIVVVLAEIEFWTINSVEVLTKIFEDLCFVRSE